MGELGSHNTTDGGNPESLPTSTCPLRDPSQTDLLARDWAERSSIDILGQSGRKTSQHTNLEPSFLGPNSKEGPRTCRGEPGNAHLGRDPQANPTSGQLEHDADTGPRLSDGSDIPKPPFLSILPVPT